MNYPLYSSILCPDIWDKTGESYVMNREVRDRLMKIAEDFTNEYLKEANITIKVRDVVVIGSIANYNWNKYSDIDLHLVFDYKDLDMTEEDAFTMLTAVKINWNKSHDIKIKGHDLELGVQGLEQENHSKSSYSVKDNKWIVPPPKESVKFDKETIKSKHKMMKEKIDDLLKSGDDAGLRKVLEKLYIMRQAGLDKQGEYSAENIVFKILRAQGYLDKIKDHAVKIYDKEMTLHESLIDDGIWPVYDDDTAEPIDGFEYTPNDRWGNVQTGEYTYIPTEDDKKRRMRFIDFKKLGRIKIFIAYEIERGAEKEFGVEPWTAIRHAVKNPKGKNISDIDELVKKSIPRMKSAKNGINIENIDIIIPLGSTSGLNMKIANEMRKSSGKDIIILQDFIVKDVWKNVKVQDLGEPSKTGYESAKDSLVTMQRDNPDVPFEIKKAGKGGRNLRRYYTFFYKTADGYDVNLLNKLSSANVLIIDDTMEEGATFKEAVRVIEAFKPKSIVGYIFLFGRYSGKDYKQLRSLE